MAMTAAQKAEIVKGFQRAEGDTGSSEVQIALLTARINDLTRTSRPTPRTTTAVVAC
ncbi:30S ribosomal protein S15 [Chromobacterium violaceum]|uniref:30S ribosomal protein S15 n=1 Tax=Chromobacterium violaceum TaxID=536 RepID=A0A3S4I5H1_CHRVL|nr:30S ribosomal protein S15 [Chromobacterium violaceum]